MTNERSNGYAAGRDSLRWAVEKAERLESENAQMQHGLERIIGMCDVPDHCTCGRPKGLGAVVACARAALPAKPGEGDE